jgi:hypothetical protein
MLKTFHLLDFFQVVDFLAHCEASTLGLSE